MTPRDLALRALNSQDRGAVLADRYLERAFSQGLHLDERDRAFTVNLVQGVFRWRLRLDWMIKLHVHFPFKKIEPPILNILRIALYQICLMDRVPEPAAVNEAVKQAKSIGHSQLAGFVNGILRDICREKERIVFPDKVNNRVQYLSVYYSYPLWLVKMWIREIGIDNTERLLEAGNRISRLVLRANVLKTDPTTLITRLREEGVKGVRAGRAPEGIEMEGVKGGVNRLRAFEEGLFQVQGEAAQVCSHLLHPGSGQSVLDLCAGLGGKSTHLAELMGNRGLILALDISLARLVRLGQNSRRLGINCIQPVIADTGEGLSRMLHYPFDMILVDGPCSGLGTISRHPDIKWARNETDIKRLAHLQRQILEESPPLLRSGGKMLYVTCTISKKENEEVVGDFLEKNRGMLLEDLRDYVPEWGMDLIDRQGFLRTFPHVHGMDGFFGALFRKA